jgi:hypothetical protein
LASAIGHSPIKIQNGREKYNKAAEKAYDLKADQT